MHSDTSFLFDPPASHTGARKRAPRGLRALKSKTSRSSSKTSNASKDSVLNDFLGIKYRSRSADHGTSPSSQSSSSASIASGSTDSTTSSSGSTATKASSISSFADHDIFSGKTRKSRESQRPQTPNGVELSGHIYKLPEPIDKGFYRDLLILEDGELIEKYELICIGPSDEVKAAEEQRGIELKDDDDEKTTRDWLKRYPKTKIKLVG